MTAEVWSYKWGPVEPRGVAGIVFLRGFSVPKVVLVVEDGPLIRLGAVSIVEDAGFDVLEAENADVAIRLLEERDDIALVFSDIDMPGSMDGPRLAHAIRERWPPVAHLLASGKAILKESQMPLGARFFPKPYRSAEIAETMRQLLSGAAKLADPA